MKNMYQAPDQLKTLMMGMTISINDEDLRMVQKNWGLIILNQLAITYSTGLICKWKDFPLQHLT